MQSAAWARGSRMADDKAGGEADDLGPPPSTEPAVALALSRPRGARRDEKLDAYLEEQTRFLRLQSEHLHDQRAQQEKHFRLRYFGDRLRIGLQLLAIGFGMILAVVIAAAVWQAHQDHGVTIEAFSVPPELAQRGLTGQVVASQLLDRLSELQAQTVTARPASSYANDWGSDIKVEIPETGVSIGELYRYLRAWLGSGTRISGEVVRTPTGFAVTARAGAAPGKTAEGPDQDLNKLVHSAAEAVYAQTQPYRHAVYLASAGRADEALAAYQRVASSGGPEDRPWAYAAWASLLEQQNRHREGAEKAEAALRLNPNLMPAVDSLMLADVALGHREQQLADSRMTQRVLDGGRAVGVDSKEVGMRRSLAQAAIDSGLGDLRGAIASLPTNGFDLEGQAAGFSPRMFNMDLLNGLHDVAGQSRLAAAGPEFQAVLQVNRLLSLEDWQSLITTIGPVPQAANSQNALPLAIAYAHLGRFEDAERLVGSTAPDCVPCLSARGKIAQLKGDWPAADGWFAEMARLTPSLPEANTAWGAMLLAKGDADGAIAKLGQAHKLGPRYADPLELWGEALMRKGDFANAARKFREADRYAPRWGRNHLLWGKALAKLGRPDEAKAQWRIARGLDLSLTERAELAMLLPAADRASD
jgi:tetratricopeptide (TPR) repeat protein